jgi:dihydrofolate synthase/folylpolyglutamate synthase
MRTLVDWLAHQQAQHPLSIDLGLERVGSVARRLGLLPYALPSVIVGGTNGKGSTTAFLTAFARAAGLRVGTYTSPHLQRYNERVALDGEPVDDGSLVSAFEAIEAVRGETPLTFFEFGTLAALWVFKARGVEVAVLEVGLGGRLDATNLVDADVAVLCSVGLDHTDWLGPTREHIGREKAGIFRAGHPVVLGSADMPQSVHARIAELGCEAVWPGRGYEIDAVLAGLPEPALQGSIQRGNAAAALTAFRALMRRRPELGRRRTLDAAWAGEGLRGARLRGRFQRIPPVAADGPEWILDVAHNEDSARSLARSLAALPCDGRTRAVVGILADKDAEAIGRILAPCIDEWVLCGLPGERGVEAEVLRRRLPPACRSVALAPDIAHGCATALALSRPGDRIVVFGSFHAVGPALDWLGV